MENNIDILNKINSLRSKMIDSGLEKGLSNMDTVNLSQKLDQLLNSYQSVQNKERQSGRYQFIFRNDFVR